jgi:hypothetical protein
VDWAGCDLKNANLPGANLAGAQLQNANLTQANMPHANLVNAALDGANLTGAVAGGVDADGATFTKATLQGAFITDADLHSAALSGVSAQGVKFINTDLKNANLQNADISLGDMSYANLFGATLTNLSDNGATWTNAICPNGASANFYADGCLSPVAVTTPTATPTVTAGTRGNNGWYTSAVTVTWYWIDSNPLPADCPASTTSTGQGTNVVVSASCTDGSGHVGNGSAVFKIDTTPPVQKLTGFRNGGVYPLGREPLPACTTTDTLSGVALYGITTILGGRPDGTGVFIVTCSRGQDNAGNIAVTVSGHYTVVYDFGGFITPRVGSALRASAPTIFVRFRLAKIDGTIIAARTQAALAARHDLRATLRGPGISPEVATCSWNSKGKFLVCPIATPSHPRIGNRRHYTITATENLGTGFVTIPVDPFSENPEPISFAP